LVLGLRALCCRLTHVLDFNLFFDALTCVAQKQKIFGAA